MIGATQNVSDVSNSCLFFKKKIDMECVKHFSNVFGQITVIYLQLFKIDDQTIKMQNSIEASLSVEEEYSFVVLFSFHNVQNSTLLFIFVFFDLFFWYELHV